MLWKGGEEKEIAAKQNSEESGRERPSLGNIKNFLNNHWETPKEKMN